MELTEAIDINIPNAGLGITSAEALQDYEYVMSTQGQIDRNPNLVPNEIEDHLVPNSETMVTTFQLDLDNPQGGINGITEVIGQIDVLATAMQEVIEPSEPPQVMIVQNSDNNFEVVEIQDSDNSENFSEVIQTTSSTTSSTSNTSGTSEDSSNPKRGRSTKKPDTKVFGISVEELGIINHILYKPFWTFHVSMIYTHCHIVWSR